MVPGKSSLVRDIFYEGVKQHLDDARLTIDCSALTGDLNRIKDIEYVDQNTIGKSSRSNPVTYVGAYDEIRKLFGAQPLAKQLDYSAAYFSFNKEGGRCEECKGEGRITVEMQFMADVALECEACHGKRFKWSRSRSRIPGEEHLRCIGDDCQPGHRVLLSKSGDTRKEDHRFKKLVPLQEVGLGYIQFGRTSSSLSGGENRARRELAFCLGQEKAAANALRLR